MPHAATLVQSGGAGAPRLLARSQPIWSPSTPWLQHASAAGEPPGGAARVGPGGCGRPTSWGPASSTSTSSPHRLDCRQCHQLRCAGGEPARPLARFGAPREAHAGCREARRRLNRCRGRRHESGSRRRRHAPCGACARGELHNLGCHPCPHTRPCLATRRRAGHAQWHGRAQRHRAAAGRLRLRRGPHLQRLAWHQHRR